MMMKLKFNKRPAGLSALLFLASSALASAALTAVSLPGTTTSEAWTTFNRELFANYPGYPGLADWPDPIASQTGDITAPDSRAVILKTGNGSGGGPYIASGYIYHGGTTTDSNVLGGSLSVSDASPLIGVRTVVFQIEVNNPFGYSFHNDVFPVLTYTAGEETETLAADYVALIDSQPDNPFRGNPVNRNTWALQWSLPEGVTWFSVDWSSVQHAQIYALQLDQSTAVVSGSVLPPAVPEPATLTGLALGALALLRRRR